MADVHSSKKRPFYTKIEGTPVMVCRDQNELASMTLHAPNHNDPANFAETDVSIESIFSEITHQYTSEMQTPLQEQYTEKHVTLRVRCAELKLTLHNYSIKVNTRLAQHLGEDSKITATRKRLRNIAQTDNNTKEQNLEASGGFKLGNFLNFSAFRGAKAKKTKEKSQNASEEVSLEIVNTKGPLVIESSGKDSFQIGSEDWGDPSSSFDDVANETHRLGARMRELKALKRSYQPLPNPSNG